MQAINRDSMPQQDTEGFIVVSRDEFFASVGQMDVIPCSEPEYTRWETRTRVVVGKSTPGYRNKWTNKGETPEVYRVKPTFYKTTVKRG